MCESLSAGGSLSVCDFECEYVSVGALMWVWMRKYVYVHVCESVRESLSVRNEFTVRVHVHPTLKFNTSALHTCECLHLSASLQMLVSEYIHLCKRR